MTRYTERLPVGSRVRIIDRARLEEFHRTGTHHHKLTPEQLACAGRDAMVRDVGFQYGGDPLYALDGLPGIWHECCLSRA